MLQRVFRSANRAGRRELGVRSSRLWTGLIASAALHLAVVLALVLGLPWFTPKDEAPLETTVAVVFQGPAKASVQAPAPADVPAPAKEVAPPAPPVTEPPKPEPIQAPPPPPPAPLPNPEIAPPTPAPPTSPPQPSPAVTPPPPTPPPSPPPEPAPAPVVIPPPPPAPPAPPAQMPPKVEPPLPPPPPAAPAPPPPPSATSQPNATKNPAPNSSSVENTLEKLRQQFAQTQPPKGRTNPQAGGQPNSGGNPLGNDTAALSADQRGAIGDHVRECWTKDPEALDLEKLRVMLTVTTDAGGIVRKAEIAGSDVGRMSDPRFRVFAERAVRAILDPRCANLPLPASALGRTNVLTFRFSP